MTPITSSSIRDTISRKKFLLATGAAGAAALLGAEPRARATGSLSRLSRCDPDLDRRPDFQHAGDLRKRKPVDRCYGPFSRLRNGSGCGAQQHGRCDGQCDEPQYHPQ